MAVVVKYQRDGIEEEDQKKGAPTFLDARIQSNTANAVTGDKGANSSVGEREVLNKSLNSNHSEAKIHTVVNVETPDDPPAQSNKWEEEVGNILVDELEALKDKYADEEVIGIITMEDVMEELLQEEILDETDLHVLNKIRLNSLPWTRSPSSPLKSPGMGSAGSQIQWNTPAASTFSSYYVLRSPIFPYAPSPLIRPTLYASPGKSNLGSPSGSRYTVRGSPSPKQISRKSYERLRHAGDS